MPSKKHAERMLHVTFGTHKKQCFGPVPKHPNAKHKQGRGVLTMASQRLVSLRSEKTETPAGSRPEEREFLYQKGCQERGFRTMAAQILVSLRSEKTETPARFEPMPSKKHAERMPHVTFGNYKKQCFGPLPKHPNASKIRAQKHAERMPHVTFGRRGANDGCSKTRQPQIRKDRNTSRIKARRTRVFCTRRGARSVDSER